MEVASEQVLEQGDRQAEINNYTFPLTPFAAPPSHGYCQNPSRDPSRWILRWILGFWRSQVVPDVLRHGAAG
jgi:hypothetical protein